MTNHLVRFALNGSECLLRIPGEGTASLLDRRQEYEVYQALAGRGISDEVLFFSPELGYKITRYIESAHNCNPGCTADAGCDGAAAAHARYGAEGGPPL